MDLSLLRLHNFWLPILWMIGAGIVLYKMPKTSVLVGGQVRERWYWVTSIMLVAPLIIWAGARNDYGDTYSYIRHFSRAPTYLEDLPVYLANNTKDQGFTILMALCKLMGVRTYSGFFMIIASVQILCMVYTFRRYSSDMWICFFLFVASTDYLSWMFNGIRQFLAATLIFAGFDLMVKKRHLSFCLVVLLASRFHGSAILMIPLAFIMHGPAFNRKTILMILGVALVIPFIDSFMPFLNELLAETQYSDITTDEIWTVDDGTNIIRVLVYSVPALLAIFGRRYVVRANDPVMNLCVNGALITMVIYLVSSVTSGIYIGRLPIYTTLHGYMALPWLIDQIFEKQSARLIKLMMVACYIAFYYYQMGVMWNML